MRCLVVALAAALLALVTEFGLVQPGPTDVCETFESVAGAARSAVLADAEYFALTLLGDEAGRPVWSAFTHFAGWVDRPGGRERRAASIVKATLLHHHWRHHGCCVVNDLVDLAIFMRLGGHGLVIRAVAEEQLAFMIRPADSAPDGLVGFRELPPSDSPELRRAPSARVRFSVMKRDGFRCRTCGRSPDDHTDVELHVHHIHPFGQGGLTEPSNLLTLCATCHRGLHPHRDFGLLALPGMLPTLAEDLRDHRLGVQRWRASISELAQREIASPPHANEAAASPQPPSVQ